MPPPGRGSEREDARGGPAPDLDAIRGDRYPYRSLLRNETPVIRPSVPLLAALLLVGLGRPAPGSAATPQSPDAIAPLLPGQPAPDAPLVSADGEETSLHAALGDARSILVFYRGGW